MTGCVGILSTSLGIGTPFFWDTGCIGIPKSTGCIGM